MKILFDQGTPVPLRIHLTDHTVHTAYECGWQSLENGELSNAELEKYEVLVTTDENLRYQQNLGNRKIAIVVQLSTSWPRIRQQVVKIRKAIAQMSYGSYHEIPIP